MASAAVSTGNPQELESLLAAFTNPDNNARQRAEAAWEGLKQRLPDEVGCCRRTDQRVHHCSSSAWYIWENPCLVMKHGHAGLRVLLVA